MTRAIAVAASLVLTLAPAALASEQHPTLAELEGEVMCPECHTTLDQSDSAIAKGIEAFIARRIHAGDTKSEIKRKLVAQFGPSILAAPPRHGFDLLAWWLPIAGVVGGGIVLGLAAWRWSRAREPAPPARLDPALDRLVDEELARLDV